MRLDINVLLYVMGDKRKFKIYNDGKVNIRVYDGDKIPDGFTHGSCHKYVAWNKGLTKEDPRVQKNIENMVATRKSNNSYIPWNKGLTKDTDIRVHGLTGESNPMFGIHRDAWNTGLTKETNTSVMKISMSNKGKRAWNKGIHTDGHKHSDETKQYLRAIASSSDTKLKRYLTMKSNGTLGNNSNTKAEQDIYSQLLLKYKKDDIVCQYFDKERYPFRCDFYIKSEDKFIEVHGTWTHGVCLMILIILNAKNN